MSLVVCASKLGLTRKQIQAGFSSFAGIKRRMEVRGEASGVTVLADFAHHPTALVDTIRAIRAKYPQQRVPKLFVPRSNTTRRNVFQRELTDALGLADGVYITRRDQLNELPENGRLNPKQIIASIRQHGIPEEYSADAAAILNSLVPQLRPGMWWGCFRPESSTGSMRSYRRD